MELKPKQFVECRTEEEFSSLLNKYVVRGYGANKWDEGYRCVSTSGYDYRSYFEDNGYEEVFFDDDSVEVVPLGKAYLLLADVDAYLKKGVVITYGKNYHVVFDDRDEFIKTPHDTLVRLSMLIEHPNPSLIRELK